MPQNPLGQAGDAARKPLAIQMFLDDNNKSVVLGAPTDTPKVNNPFYEATELDRKGDKAKAKEIYLQLLDANFGNSVLCAALGMLYCTMGRSGIAHNLLMQALARLDAGHMIEDFKVLGITPKAADDGALAEFLIGKRSEILNALGTTFKHENRVPEARSLFEEAQSLIKPNADIQNNLGTLFINEGHPERALPFLETAVRIDPQHAQAHWNRSLAWLEMGDYEHGFPEYDYGFKAGVRIERNYGKEKLPNWDGTPGKRLVVYGEQGIGDEIMFMSMLPDLLRDCPDTVLECHRNLHEIFAASFPNIDIYPTREDQMLTWPLKPDGSKRYEFDAKISIGSLGQFYRRDIEAFPGTPYLRPPVDKEQQWAERLHALGNKPKIGLSWIGGHKRTRVEVRSLELERMLPILEAGRDKVDFISLQYTPAEHEIEQFTAKHGIPIHHWPEAVYNQNYGHTAGLVSNLDLVISVCTSVIHLAGAIGVPCWILTPSRPAWRYGLTLSHLPWYGHTCTLFRQKTDTTDWDPVVTELTESLKGMLNAFCIFF